MPGKKNISPGFIILLVLCFFLPGGCGKKTDYGDPSSVLRGFSDAVSIDERKKFLTSESSARAASDPELFAYPFYIFGPKTQWIVTGQSSQGDHTRLNVKITAHVTENIIGNEVLVDFKKERGVWLLDLRLYVDEKGGSAGSGSPADYIKNLGRQ